MIRMRIGITAALALLACTSPAETPLESGVLRYGTSFGMCAGYCRQEIEVNSLQVKLTRTSWDPQHSPTVVQTIALTSAERRQLLAQIDTGDFRALQEVYGCPDCADGGAEWVELQGTDLTKKVTWEYNSAPSQLKNAVAALRALRQRFPD